SSHDHATRWCIGGRTADRVPACRRPSRRGHASSRRRSVPACHVLASSPSFPHLAEAALTIPFKPAGRSIFHGQIFHGWFVVAAAFAVMFVGFGSAYTFSAFLEPLQRDFGASRGSISLVFSIAGFLYVALGLVS